MEKDSMPASALRKLGKVTTAEERCSCDLDRLASRTQQPREAVPCSPCFYLQENIVNVEADPRSRELKIETKLWGVGVGPASDRLPSAD